jgi:sulfoxide reductase heme-binding subunit YedZ
MIHVGRVLGPGVRGRVLAKVVIFVAALIPAALLVRGVLTGNLGVNPAETIQLETGRWTFKFLLLTLAVTPLRRISGWNVVIQYRRMLGLFAFFYGTLHFASYWAFDLVFAFGRCLPTSRSVRSSRWASRRPAGCCRWR